MRFRRRRRRAAALVLLPGLAALTLTAPGLGAEEPAGKAKLKTGKWTITYGSKVRLGGRFPGAERARVWIEYRGSKGGWKLKARSMTNRKGQFARKVRPPASARWRARLPHAPVPEDSEAQGETSDSGTSAEGETTTSEQTTTSDGTGEAEQAGDGTAEPASTEGDRDQTVDRRTGKRRIVVRSRTHAGVSSRNVKVAQRVRIKGRVKPGGERRRVVIHAGRKTMKTRTSRSGKFSKTWRPGSAGTYRVKVRAKANSRARGSRAGAGKVQVFRPAAASWYGPGFYGNRTACGRTLTTSTQGVAHKTMPCGTKVTLRYGGREVRVPVIDRGPYAHGREYDLTSATKRRLGFGSTGTVLSSR